MQKSFDVTGPVDLDVTLSSGEVRIDPVPSNELEVELVGYDDASRELIDSARVELRGGSRPELVVEVPQRRGFSISFSGRSGILCSVRCPEGSSLRARTKSGSVRVTGDLTDVDVSTASGDTSLRDVRGSLSYKGASGDVEAGAIAGTSGVNTASGDVSIGSAAERIAINSASGDISVGSLENGGRANTASGDVRIEAVRAGTVAVNSASGDVTIGIREGSRAHLDCSTVSGDTRSELEVLGDQPAGDGPLVEVKARTVSGDIVISRASAPADARWEVQA